MSKQTWVPPVQGEEVSLHLYNSLTRSKEKFIPANGRQVNWYSCGPTVYDTSHMGHARSYITFDILRRVLTDYFKYEVLYVMNITDIDDKIIKRARQNHLMNKYREEKHPLEKISSDYRSALQFYSSAAEKEEDSNKKMLMDSNLVKLRGVVTALEEAVKAGDDAAVEEERSRLLVECTDPLVTWLDHQHGAQVKDHHIFNKLSRYWEEEFHKDMDALNVRPADFITRVSEYVPEIVEYIQKIISNGLAYESNGSVYFATSTFHNSPNHSYAKLLPEAFGDEKALQEGEGDLSAAQEERKSPNDFALWKDSKPGEPSWESPWGLGRPGWHIECSVMASAVIGDTLDIHTGGVDLKFPHHDNEMAQAEAYYGNEQWVNYFLHSGHLHISGCKMSKSLKNFISIKDALKTNTARQLRLAFLLHSWHQTLDYSSNTMDLAKQYEKMVNEFFLNVKSILHSGGGFNVSQSDVFVKCGDAELELNRRFFTERSNVHKALCDNIDTRRVLDCLRELITSTNIYLKTNKDRADKVLLNNIGVYITKILRVFGAVRSDEELGFGSESVGDVDRETVVLPYLTALAEFRERVRVCARECGAVGVLRECDEMRDNVLPLLGVRLEDHEGQHPVIKLVDRDQLIKERDEKVKIEEEKRLKKEKQRAEMAEKQAARDAQRKINPSDMFLAETDKYSQWDNQGLPTHDKEGKEVSKGVRKKLQKLYDAQDKKYQEYLKDQANVA